MYFWIFQAIFKNCQLGVVISLLKFVKHYFWDYMFLVWLFMMFICLLIAQNSQMLWLLSLDFVSLCSMVPVIAIGKKILRFLSFYSCSRHESNIETRNMLYWEKNTKHATNIKNKNCKIIIRRKNIKKKQADKKNRKQKRTDVRKHLYKYKHSCTYTWFFFFSIGWVVNFGFDVRF